MGAGRVGPVGFATVPEDTVLVKRLMWSGLVAIIGVGASIAANRVAATIWRRVFEEDPPD